MTVTQRRIRTEPGKSDAPLGMLTKLVELTTAAEPGIKYTCDCCT